MEMRSAAARYGSSRGNYKRKCLPHSEWIKKNSYTNLDFYSVLLNTAPHPMEGSLMDSTGYAPFSVAARSSATLLHFRKIMREEMLCSMLHPRLMKSS